MRGAARGVAGGSETGSVVGVGGTSVPVPDSSAVPLAVDRALCIVHGRLVARYRTACSSSRHSFLSLALSSLRPMFSFFTCDIQSTAVENARYLSNCYSSKINLYATNTQVIWLALLSISSGRVD